jgi:hypothetical protein
MSPWAALEWIRHSVAALAIVVTCVIVLALQFSRRLTSVSRIIALTSLLILIVALPRSSWRTAFAWQAALAPPDQPLSAELARPEATFAASPDRIHQIRMAFRILGPPPGTPIMCDGAEVTLETPSGPWNTGLQGAHAGTRSRVDEGCHVVIAAPPAQMREIWDRPVTVHATIYVTMLGPERAVSIPTDGSLAAVQNVGVCRGIVVEEPLAPAPRQPEAYVGCQTALREPRSVMEISTNHRTEPLSIGRLSYSPFPAALTLQPVRTFGFHRFPAADVATLAAREAAGHARLVVDVANVRLAELAQ